MLGQAGTGIDYADLFLRARAVVRRYADVQTPQFETYVGFNAYSGFLGTAAAGQGQRFRVSFDQGAWKANCGALHGLPTDPERMVELALYREADPGVLAGHAQTTQGGAQVSEVRILDLAATEEDRFQAQVSSLPVPPRPVRLTGDLDGIAAVQTAAFRRHPRRGRVHPGTHRYPASGVTRHPASGTGPRPRPGSG